ncbi:MAG: hypothetical protein L0Z62_17520 [Gemmataceae bacterium]|nr:hypothetical protein [Gemmataceae bacterium]
MPDLGPRLEGWLRKLPGARALIVPGGGPTANLIRELDRRHALGEERAHWLALQALTLNAHFLAALLSAAAVVPSLGDCTRLWQEGSLPILDAYAFARADEGQPGALPHCWAVTSDSLAARVARLARARQLILLKSIDFPPETAWPEAHQRGWVDAYFASVLGLTEGNPSALEVQAVNFRCLQD